MDTILDKEKIWHDVLESIKVLVSPAIFSTWFSQTHLSEIKKSDQNIYLAEIGCSSTYVKTTIEGRYLGLTQDCLSKILGISCGLVFIVKEKPKTKPRDEISSPLFATNDKDNDMFNLLTRSKIRSGFTFDNFAVSSSNQMAWAAAEAVSKNPGQAYNPLFIWGGVGVGKSHLMMSVGYEILKKNPGMKVLMSTGEEFTNGIIEGIRNKSTSSFRERYRKLNCLLLDDIQFIAGKDTVQEEFFHTFNAINSEGGQIILTSDKPPSDIAKFEERLRSRFEAGLIVDIASPDFELRCAITQIKAKQKGLNLENDVVQLIAGNLDAARKIEGFLIRLISEVKIKNTELNAELINSLIGKGDRENGKKIKIKDPEEVIDAVCKYFSVGKKAIMSHARPMFVTRPRQILMYLLRVELGLPLEKVGDMIGGRDHTTVMHAVDKITTIASNDVKIREDILGIKNLL